MATARKIPIKKPASPKTLEAVARQQLVLINGLLDEVARNHVARLHREIDGVIRALETSPGVSGRQSKGLREMLKRIAHLQIDPEKGRRKDLKKIDVLIGELQAIVERW